MIAPLDQKIGAICSPHRQKKQSITRKPAKISILKIAYSGTPEMARRGIRSAISCRQKRVAWNRTN
jgi:hypothetical protein